LGISFGTKFSELGLFEITPKAESWLKREAPLTHGAALAQVPPSRGRAPPRRGCARPGCARPAVARGCASPPGFGWEGEEREREGEREREREFLGFGFGSSEIFTEKEKLLLSDPT